MKMRIYLASIAILGLASTSAFAGPKGEPSNNKPMKKPVKIQPVKPEGQDKRDIKKEPAAPAANPNAEGNAKVKDIVAQAQKAAEDSTQSADDRFLKVVEFQLDLDKFAERHKLSVDADVLAQGKKDAEEILRKLFNAKAAKRAEDGNRPMGLGGEPVTLETPSAERAMAGLPAALQAKIKRAMDPQTSKREAAQLVGEIEKELTDIENSLNLKYQALKIEAETTAQKANTR